MSLDYAILGFLSYRPASGYDLKRKFDGSIRHFWPADQSQIYKSLARLTEQELTTVEVVAQDGRPNRKVYHITEAGRDALISWIGSPPASEEARRPFLIQVFFAGLLSDEDAIGVLEAKAEELRRSLGSCAGINQAIAHADADEAPPRERFFWFLTLESGLWAGDAMLRWIELTMDRIRTKEHEAGPHIVFPQDSTSPDSPKENHAPRE